MNYQQPTATTFDAGDNPSTKKSLRTDDHGRTPTFQRQPVNAGRQDLAFTGRGFIPDYMSEHSATMMPEASRTTLEIEGVYGGSGMMPPAGKLSKLQPGSGGTDNGTAGGAGSFGTVVADGYFPFGQGGR
jgi:hypothetical protein